MAQALDPVSDERVRELIREMARQHRPRPLLRYTNPWWNRVLFSLWGGLLLKSLALHQWHRLGCQLLFLTGAIANVLVVHVNHGYMPVLGLNPHYPLSRGHCHGDRTTRLWWLADRFHIGGVVASPGDILVAVGMLWLVLIA